MKLFYTPNADGTAAFIAAYIGAQSYTCEAMESYGPKSKTADGMELSKISESSKLPCFVIDENTVLTEEPAILSFIGDKVLYLLQFCKYI